MKNFLKSKKLYLILLGVIILGIILIFCFILKGKNDNSKLVYINAHELQTKIDNKESFMLVVSQTGCPHCEQYLPELENALKDYNFFAYVINLSKLNSDDAKLFNNLVNVSGTPTTIFFKNGVETTTLNRIVGSSSQTNIIERLKSLGYIE